MRAIPCCLLASLLALSACKESHGKAEAAAEEPVAPVSKIDAAVAPAIPKPPPEKLEGNAIKQHMQGQMSAVSSIQSAVIHGDLEAAKSQANSIASLRTYAFPEAWDLHLLKMEQTAMELAEAGDLRQAAAKTAELGLRCTRCHADLTAVVSFEWIEAPPDSDDTKITMRRHRWAAARLWEGFVGPSDVLWNRAAAALAGERIDVARATGGKKNPEAEKLAATVRELGNRALVAKEHEARTEIMGALLDTCSRCHALVRTKP